jgi:hypothetical protein
MQILPGQTQSLWVTLAVPRQAKPGQYSAAVLINTTSPLTNSSLWFDITSLVWNISLPSLAQSEFTSFFQFQYQHQAFGAIHPGNIRGDLLPYYGQQRLPDIKAAYFKLLCASRTPPIGYQWLRTLSDMTAIRSDLCTGVSAIADALREEHLVAAPAAPAAPAPAAPAAPAATVFSVMDVSILFDHKQGSVYNSSYLALLWLVLDPVVDQLNATGLLAHAAVYGFDEAHPKALYEPLISGLFGAVKSRYNGQLKTIATLHFCPSMDTPIDILVHAYHDWPNGTDHPANYGVPGQPGEFCEVGFPIKWVEAAPNTRQYWFYHCFSPRGAHDNISPSAPQYGAMNTFVDYPRIHNRLLPWWASVNEGVTGWLYFEVSEWRFDTNANPRVVLPPEVQQPNTGFADDRLDGKSARVSFNVNKFYANIYGGGTTAGDGIFLYPGKEGPLMGARLETWRDGSEDYEMFAQLPSALRRQLVHQLVSGLASWTDDAELLERTRRQAAAILERKHAGEGAGGQQPAAPSP